MANQKTTSMPPGTTYLRLDTTESQIDLGNAHEQTGGSFVLHLKPAASLTTGGLVVKGRVHGAAIADAQSLIVYGPNSDTQIAAGTKLATAGLYYVVADGLAISLDYTQDTSSLEVWVRKGQF